MIFRLEESEHFTSPNRDDSESRDVEDVDDKCRSASGIRDIKAY